MLSASRRIGFLDDLKVPYVVRADERLDAAGIVAVRAADGSRSLAWPSEPTGDAAGATPFAWGRYPGVLLDGAASRDEQGNVFLPFDPDAAIERLASEAYLASATTARARWARHTAIRTYYGVRPLVPRGVQIGMRRAFAHIQRRVAFPRWPIETSLHDLEDDLLDLLAGLVDAPLPFIRPWPGGYTWAVVLTHDVETQTGHDEVARILEIEERLGLRSSWHFVPKRYAVDDRLVGSLWERGFEVGVHGVYHDGRDLASKTMLTRRLPELQAAAKRWRSVGFRAPATQRSWSLMPLLPFDYDSSYPDTDPFEPQGGGCCRWLPFFIDRLVELPITLVQDHTLFVILRERDERLWALKARLLRERGGMALLLTHPDYMLGDRLGVYDRFLSVLASDDSAWHALPHEVSAWWRRRAESSLVESDGEWRVEGPAEREAEVGFVTSGQPQTGTGPARSRGRRSAANGG